MIERWYPDEPRWWFRWWMYPPMHRRRIIGVGATWEYRLYFWAHDLKRRLTPGQCVQCGAKKGRHKMRCPTWGTTQVVLPMTWRDRG